MHNNNNPHEEFHPKRNTTQNQKGPEMSDRDRINDLLATEKYLCDGYNVGVCEAGNDQLYQIQMQLLNECHQSQRELFKVMEQKGWYKLEPEQHQSKIIKKAQQFASYRTQFPYA